MESEKKVPTITIRVVSRENFLVEVEKAAIPNPGYALAMLDFARRAIDQERQDLEAIEFSQKMEAAARMRNMQMMPGRKV